MYQPIIIITLVLALFLSAYFSMKCAKTNAQLRRHISDLRCRMARMEGPRSPAAQAILQESGFFVSVLVVDGADTVCVRSFRLAGDVDLVRSRARKIADLINSGKDNISRNIINCDKF